MQSQSRRITIREEAAKPQPLAWTAPADNPELYNALKALRLRLAQREHMPAYIVFTNATLEDMARKAPRTMEEFCCVSGVGSTKAQRYGKVFLQAIREFCPEQSQAAPEEP